MKIGNKTVLKIVSVVAVVIGWEVLSMIFPPSLIPSVESIVGALWQIVLSGELLKHAVPTIYRVYLGFLIALTLGMLIGILMGRTKGAEHFFDFPILLLLAVPSLCWSILGLLWFGLTDTAGVFVIAVIALPVIIINTHEGVKNVDKDLINMSQAFNVSTLDIIWGVYLPSIFPYVLSASRYAVGLCWKIAIIAEMLGMSSGVGYIINFYYSLFEMTQVLAWTLFFSLIIVVVDNIILRGIEGRVMRWRKA